MTLSLPEAMTNTPNDPPILVTLYASQYKNGEWYACSYRAHGDTLKITVRIENGAATAEAEVLK
jgi:hypothetical protein